MITRSKIINTRTNKVYNFFLDFKNIPLLFNHISAITDYNNLECCKIGKKYAEETKNLLGLKRIVIVELYSVNKPNYIIYRTNHWFSKHEVCVDFKAVSASKTKVSITFIFKKNLWLGQLFLLRKIFQNRLDTALTALEILYE